KFLRSNIVKTTAEIAEIWNTSQPGPSFTAAPSAAATPTAATVKYRNREILNTENEILNPKHTVLLVHEMLNDFITKGGGFDRAGRGSDADARLEPIAKLLSEARAKKVRVAYVRWTNYADNSTMSDPMLRTGLARLASGQYPASAVEGSWGWQIADPVKPQPGEWVLRKYRPDAFFATPLDTLMRWNGMKTLVIVGVGAEVGVVPTLMTASNLGYFRVAVSDCLRPTDPARLND